MKSSPPNRPTLRFWALNLIILLLALTIGIIQIDKHYLPSLYVFDPPKLETLATQAIAANKNSPNQTRAIVDFIVRELKADPEVAPYVDVREEWIFNNAGGAMGAMWILHASITEYLIIFGTAIGTEGHTGRHTADDYFHILTGTQLAYSPSTSPFEAEVYGPGSVHHLRRGDVKQYKMESSCFAMEYARGWIPPMCAFGYADTFFSTLDVPTIWRTTVVTARQMGANLLRGKI